MKEHGRWSIYECEKYIEVLKSNLAGKSVIKEIKEALPLRTEAQIRAHHQKMLKKYGSFQEIIRVVGRNENDELLQIGQKFDESLQKFSGLISQLKFSLNLKHMAVYEEDN